jgi:hypothetical protein
MLTLHPLVKILHGDKGVRSLLVSKNSPYGQPVAAFDDSMVGEAKRQGHQFGDAIKADFYG